MKAANKKRKTVFIPAAGWILPTCAFFPFWIYALYIVTGFIPLPEDGTDGGRVGETGGFHKDHVKILLLQTEKRVLKLFDLTGAENGAVVDLFHLDIEILQQRSVYALLAELVDDDGCAPVRKQTYKLVQERRLPRPEKSGDKIQLCHDNSPLFSAAAQDVFQAPLPRG